MEVVLIGVSAEEYRRMHKSRLKTYSVRHKEGEKRGKHGAAGRRGETVKRGRGEESRTASRLEVGGALRLRLEAEGRRRPLKDPVKEKTLLHRKRDDFLQGYLRPAAVWSPPLSAPCFSFDGGVGLYFDPHQSPIGIKVRMASSLWS